MINKKQETNKNYAIIALLIKISDAYIDKKEQALTVIDAIDLFIK